MTHRFLMYIGRACGISTRITSYFYVRYVLQVSFHSVNTLRAGWNLSAETW